MKKISSAVFTLFFLTVSLFAQDDQLHVPHGDETLFGETGLRLTGAWGGPAFGAAMFDEETVPTIGGFGGLEFNRVLFVGIGGQRTIGAVKLKEMGNENFKLRQRGFLIGFIPLSQKIIHPKVSFSMAGGEVEKGGMTDDVFVVQPGLGLEINMFQWWKFGIEGGYRFVTRTDVEGLENEDLSAFYLNLQLRFGFSWND